MSPRRSAAAARAQTQALAERVPDVVEGLLSGAAAPDRPHGSPAIAVLMGFPGVGKTHCARLLATRLRAAHVASDELRGRLFVAASYADAENAALFRIVNGLVGRLVELGHRVVVDATHLTPRTRSGVEQVARERGVPLAHVLVTSDEADVLARLAERRVARAAHDRSDADERVYRAMRDRGFEPPGTEYLTVRNGPGVAQEVDRAADALEARWRAS